MSLNNYPKVLGGGNAITTPAGGPIVSGPTSSTDKALVRWNGTTGSVIQNGVVVEADNTGNLTGAADQATTTAAGIGYTNQPLNDSVTVVSDNAGDVQTLTLIGTTTATNTVVTEAIVMTGVTPVVSVKVNWGKILAVKLSSAAVGTITVKKTTGAATITTLAAAATSSGVTTVTNTAAFNQLLSTVASGATTKQIGWGGTNTSGTQIYDSNALNGTTAVASNSTFYTLTEIYRGDLEATRTVTVTTTGTWTLTGGGGGVLSFNTAGSITATAGGTNQNITLTPSGTGFVRDTHASISNYLGAQTNAATYGALFLAATPGAANFSLSSDGAEVILNAPGASSSVKITAANTRVLEIGVGGAVSTIRGGSGSMTITSGSGNSNTMTLRTTTSGGTATNFLVADATQGVTLGSLAGTGSRAVLADANGLLSAPVSDETWKENLRSLPDSMGLATVMALNPLMFSFKDKSRFGSQDYIGFGARETAKILPQVTGQDRDGVFYITEEKLTAVLVKAVQQLVGRVQKLESA